MCEQWKIIKEFPNYAISNYGQVKRIGCSPGVMVNRILHHTISKNGYHSVLFYKRIEGIKKLKSCRLYVHRIVAQSFIDNPTNLPQVNHIDGNKSNNFAGNLEWINYSDNHKHAFQLGLRKVYRHSKLTPLIVREIKNSPKYYGSRMILANRFNISPYTVDSIRNGKRWSHLS